MSSQQDEIHAGEPNPGQVDASVQSDSHVEEADQLDPDYVDDGDQSEDELAGAPEAPEVVEFTKEVLPSSNQFLGYDLQGRPLPRLPLVGPQEIREDNIHKHYVLSGTEDDIMKWMQEPVQNLVRKDRNYHKFAPGSQDHADFAAAIRTRVRGFLTPVRDDDSLEEGFGFHCEYTGLQCIVGGVRGPLSPSIEAQNAFGWVCLAGGERRVIYHSPYTGSGDRENLRIVSWGVNRLHGHHPIAAMPFVGRILRATTDSDNIFQQQEELQLCFNALTNIGTISAVTGNTFRHDLRHQRWVDLSPAEAEAVFETLRTADRSPYVNDFISLFSNEQLFRTRDFEKVHEVPTPPPASECAQLYNWCRQISSHYRLTLNEFHHLCCIRDPEPAERFVFFPFYYLSKPEAIRQRWDWASCAAFFRHRLRRVIKECGKASAEQGYLSKETWESLLLACAHLWCGMVRRAKDKVASLAGADDSHVKWLILDSFGVPFVWWWNSFLTFSINKRIHGMVMGFGWEKRPGDDGFDPVAHYHHQQSNLSLDSQLTNQAVHNYPLAVWEEIRSLVAAIRFVLPGESPCWQVDETQHREIWRSEREGSIVKGRPSIESVLSSTKVRTLDTSVVRDVSGQSSPTVVMPPSRLFAANKSRSDREFWKDAFEFICEDCSASFSYLWSLGRHQDQTCPVLHPDGPERLHECDGCGISFNNQSNLKQHSKTCTTCPGCKETFPDARTRAKHQGGCTGKPGLVAWPDSYSCEGCGISFNNQSNLKQHSKTCTTCPGCKETFPDARTRAKHQGGCTGKSDLVAWPDSFLCEACGESFTLKGNLDQHQKFCTTCPGCKETFPDATARAKHQGGCTGKPKLVAWPDSFLCEACGQSSTLKKDRDRHQKICKTCPGCKAKFADARTRAEHQGGCTGKSDLVAWPDSFLCEACGRSFTLKKDRTKHRKTGCLKCLYCRQDFKNPGGCKARQKHEVNCPARPKTPSPKNKPIKKKQKSASNNKVANPSYSASTSSSLPHLRPAAQKSPTKTSTKGGQSTKLDAVVDDDGDGADGALTVASGAAPGVSGPSGAASVAASGVSGASPSGASPSGASPSGASPSGASPSGASPSGASPSGASPSGASAPSAPSGASPASPSLRQDGLTDFPRRAQMHDIPTPFDDRPDWLANYYATTLMFSGLQYDGSPQDLGSSAAAGDTRWLTLIMWRYNLAGRLARREWLVEEDINAQTFEIFRGVRPQHMVYEEHAGSLLSPSVHLGNALSRSDSRFGIDDHRNAARVAFSVNTGALFSGQTGQASHWFLAVYDRTRNTVTIADSQQQGPGSPRYRQTLERVAQYLHQLGRGDAFPTLEILDVPQQTDGASCGLHTLSNLAALVRGGTHHSRNLFELWERRIWNQLGQTTATRERPRTSQHNYEDWVSPEASPPPSPPPPPPPPPSPAKLDFKDTGLTFGDAPPAPAPQIQPLLNSKESAPPLALPPAFISAQQYGIFPPFQSEALVNEKVQCNLCHKSYKPRGIRQHIHAVHPKCGYCGLRVFRRENIGLHEGKCPKRTIPDSDDGNSDDNIG